MFIMLITEMRDKILPRKHRFCNDISDVQAHVSVEKHRPCTCNVHGGGNTSETNFSPWCLAPVRHASAPSTSSQTKRKNKKKK